MKNNNFLICLMVIVTVMLNVLSNSICRKYDELYAKGDMSITIEDLPPEFSEKP